MTTERTFVLYAIYKTEEAFAIRRYDGGCNKLIDREQPFARANTLEEIRSALPYYSMNIGRVEADDPRIVEIWMPKF